MFQRRKQPALTPYVPWKPTLAQVDAGIAVLEIEPGPEKKERKKRSKGERVLNPYEWEIQTATVLILKRILAPPFFIAANVNENRGSDIAGSKARQMGQEKDEPDLDVVQDGKLRKIEFKDRTGKARPSQLAMHAHLRECGIPVLSECRSPEQAVDWLREQGYRFRGTL
jgi:hypothetical protein